MDTLFEHMISRLETLAESNKINGLREIIQQITLAGLNRDGFFDHAAFRGNSCLRLLHGISLPLEEMEFSLLQTDKPVDPENYLDAITSEFRAAGQEVIIEKEAGSPALKAYRLQLAEQQANLAIKINTRPLAGFTTEHNPLAAPFSLMIRCYALTDLHAEKTYALLFHNPGGRDWYDFEWCVRRDVPLHFAYLQQQVKHFNAIPENNFSTDHFKEVLREKIARMDVDAAKNDLLHLVKDPARVSSWNRNHLLRIAEKIRIDE